MSTTLEPSTDSALNLVAAYEFFLSGEQRQQVHILQSSTQPSNLLLHPIFERFHVSEPGAAPVLILQPQLFGVRALTAQYVKEVGGVISDEIFCGPLRNTQLERLGEHHRIIVSNYHQAVTQQVLDAVNVIVLCNTQERSAPMTLCKAILHKRLLEKRALFLLVISPAPQQINDEEAYWCDRVGHTPAWPLITHEVADQMEHICQWNTAIGTPEETFRDILLTKSLGKGAVICLSRAHKPEEFLQAVSREVPAALRSNIDFITLTHRMSIDEQEQALSEPLPDRPRVLFNTGVLETSGMELSWPTHVISDGLYRTTVISPINEDNWNTVLVDAPRDYLTRQARISGWATESHYHLCHIEGAVVDDRPALKPYEVTVVPTSTLVLDTLKVGHDPSVLFYDAFMGEGFRGRGDAIRRLINFGFAERDERGKLSLTQTAKQMSGVELTLPAKAMLVTAVSLDVVAEALPLIALIELGGLRIRPSTTAVLDADSDVFDAALRLGAAITANKEYPNSGRYTKFLEYYGVKPWQVANASRVISALGKYCGVEADSSLYARSLELDPSGDHRLAIDRPEVRRALLACVFTAYRKNIFSQSYDSKRATNGASSDTRWTDQLGVTYYLNNSSVLRQKTQPDRVITGVLRTITSKKQPGRSFDVIDQATSYTPADWIYMAKRFPHWFQLRRYLTGVDMAICIDDRQVALVPTLDLWGNDAQQPIRKEASPEGVPSGTDQIALTPTPIVAKVKPKAVQKSQQPKAPKVVVETATVAIADDIKQLGSAWGARVSAKR